MVNGPVQRRFGVPGPVQVGRFGAPTRRVVPTPVPTRMEPLAPTPSPVTGIILTPEQREQEAQRQQSLATNRSLLADTQTALAKANTEFKEKFEGADAGTRDRLRLTQNFLNARFQALKTVVSRLETGETITQKSIDTFVSARESGVTSRLEAEAVRKKDVERLVKRLGGTKAEALAEQRSAELRLKGVLEGRPVSSLTVEQAEQLTARQREVLQITITKPTEDIEPIVTRPEEKVVEREIQPTGIVFATPEPEGILETLERFISQERAGVTTKRIQELRFGELTAAEVITGVSIGALASVVGTVRFAQQFSAAPIQTIKGVSAGIRTLATEGIPDVGQVLREEPGFALGFITAEVGQDIVLGKGLQKVATLGDLALTRTGIRGNFINVVEKGDIDGLKNIDDIVDIEITGRFGGEAGLKLEDLGPKTKVIEVQTTKGKLDIEIVEKGTIPTKTLREQALLEGQKIDTVSAASDFFSKRSQDEVLIRKSLAKEDTFTPKTKSLLKKFDEGTLSKKEFVELDKRLVQVEKTKGLLETSFFAVPEPKLRLSRLFPEQKQATILDLFSGDVRFTRPAAQLLLEKGTPVARFPNTPIFRGIRKKLLTNKGLNEVERLELLRFQLKRSKEFKPIGFIGPEAEVTRAPGVIQRVKERLGRTIIDRKVVQVIETEAVLSTDLIPLFEKGDLTPSDIRTLSRKTGFTPKELSSLSRIDQPVASPVRLATSLSTPVRSTARISIRRVSIDSFSPSTSSLPSAPIISAPSISTPSTSTPSVSIPTPSPLIPSLITPSPAPISPLLLSPLVPSPVTPSPVIPSPLLTTPAIIPPPAVIIRLPTIEPAPPKKPKRRQQGYVASIKPVKLKGEKRLPDMDINKKPLTKELAKDARDFVLDTSLSATGKIRRVKGRPATSVQEADVSFPQGFSNRNINKFRKFKQVKGKRIKLVNTVIEKRNRRLDTIGEIQQIKGAGRIAQIKKRKGSALDLINNL